MVSNRRRTRYDRAMDTAVKIAPIRRLSPRLVWRPKKGKTMICVVVATTKPIAVDVQASISDSRRLCIRQPCQPPALVKSR